MATDLKPLLASSRRALEERLRAACTEVVLDTPYGRTYRLPEGTETFRGMFLGGIGLEEFLKETDGFYLYKAAAEACEERDWYDEILRLGKDVQPFLDCEWHNMPASLACFELFKSSDGMLYLVGYNDDDFQNVAFAAIETTNWRAFCPQFFRSFLAENGRRYGVDIFGDPPSRLDNRIPGLVPEQVVREVLMDWVEWHDRFPNSTSWVDLRDRMIGDATGTHAMDQLLDALKSMPRPDQIEDWLIARREASDNITAEDKQAIIALYMKTCYLEKSKPPKKAAILTSRRSCR